MSIGNPNSFGTYLESITRSAAQKEQRSAPSDDPILIIATVLEEKGPQTFTELCNATGMRPSSVIEELQRMEQFGLLDSKGKEAGKIELMEAGHELAKSVTHGLGSSGTAGGSS